MRRLLSPFLQLLGGLHKRLAPLSYAAQIGVTFGKGCRFINVDFGTEPYLVKLGDRVSITKSHFITHDGSVWIIRDKYPDADIFGPITIGNNVFIGIGCTILPGVTIGDNVIIGAHSLVIRDIPSGVVAAGTPARTIRSIDEYCARIVDRIVPTKNMSPQAKREYLLKEFRNLSPHDLSTEAPVPPHGESDSRREQ